MSRCVRVYCLWIWWSTSWRSNYDIVYEETAVTIGYSCRLLSSSDTIETYVVDAESVETVRSQLTSARDHMCQLLTAGQLVLDGLALAPWMTHVWAAKCLGRSLSHTAEVVHGSCALVINGHSLVLHVHLCCKGCFWRAVSSYQLSFSTYSRKDKQCMFLWVGCCSCHPADCFKVLNGTYEPDSTQRKLTGCLIFSLFSTRFFKLVWHSVHSWYKR